MQAQDVVVRDVPGSSRYEIELAGERVGLADYRRRGTTIAFTHTEIDPAHGGQGLGRTLVRYALDRAREEGLQVAPYCSFVRRVVAESPEYLALVPGGDRARFGLPTAG